MKDKCIIDNWSIYLVSEFFKNYPKYLRDIQYSILNKEKEGYLNYLSKYFGSLSNIINGLVFYDKILYIETGNEYTWMENSLFMNEYENLFIPQKVPDEYSCLYDKTSSNKDTEFYILTAKILNSDLFISPSRADGILNSYNFSLPTVTNNLLESLDKKISECLREKDDSILRIGLESNQILPSLTQFVLNESSCMGDIFQTARQLRESNPVKEYRNKVIEIIESENRTKNYTKLKKNFEIIFEDMIYKLNMTKTLKQHFCDVSFKLWIFNFDKIHIPNPHLMGRKNRYTILLKNIAKYRLEMYNSIDTLERIMKQ